MARHEVLRHSQGQHQLGAVSREEIDRHRQALAKLRSQAQSDTPGREEATDEN